MCWLNWITLSSARARVATVHIVCHDAFQVVQDECVFLFLSFISTRLALTCLNRNVDAQALVRLVAAGAAVWDANVVLVVSMFRRCSQVES
jgi:hypothetical protein